MEWRTKCQLTSSTSLVNQWLTVVPGAPSGKFQFAHSIANLLLGSAEKVGDLLDCGAVLQSRLQIEVVSIAPRLAGVEVRRLTHALQQARCELRPRYFHRKK
jgi:hypothetical protein